MESRDRDSILRDLEHADEEIRRLAVERLNTLVPSEAIPVLVDQLGDSSWRVRKAAIERLAACPETPSAARALVAALADGENPGRRNAALEALTRCGSPAVPTLLEATSDADVDVRKQVVDALAGIGDEGAADQLGAMLEDEDPNVRGAAADALGAIGAERSVALLLESARTQDDPLVRLSCLRALARMEASVPVAQVASLADEPLLRPGLHHLLGCCEGDAIELLLKGLGASGRSAREAAMESIVRLAVRGVAPSDLSVRLAETLADRGDVLTDAFDRLAEGPLPTRLALVQFLALTETRDAIIPILKAGRDEALLEIVLAALVDLGADAEAEIDAGWESLDDGTRTIACRVLARTQGGAAEGRLRRALAGPDVELRAAAARALGEAASTDALPELVALLETATTGSEVDAEMLAPVILDAIACIARTSDTASGRAVELLDERLDSAAAEYRLAAARLLGEVGRPADRDRLTLLLSDPEARVRRAAVEAIAFVAPDATEPLRLALADEAAAVRIGAAGALAQSGDSDAILDLANLSEDEDERVRAAAMRAAGTWARVDPNQDTGRALSLLAAGLRRGGAVSMAALEALSHIGGAAVVPLARGVLDDADPELVRAAVACVGAHGSREELLDLTGLVSHEHWSVRAEVVAVMSTRRIARAVPAILRRLEAEQDDFVRDAILAALRTLEE